MANQPGSCRNGGAEDNATSDLDDGVWRDGGAILSVDLETGRVRVLLPGRLYGLEFAPDEALALLDGLELVGPRLREILGDVA